MRANRSRRTETDKLARAKAQLAAWRAQCRGPGCIPTRLWRLAAEAAAQHGIQPTARQLLLDPARLQKWLQQREVPAPSSKTSCTNIIELD